MAADENLNEQQFISVRRLMKMPHVDANLESPSFNHEGMSPYHAPTRVGRTKSTAGYKANEVKESPLVYGHDFDEALRNGTIDPVHVDTGESMRKTYDAPVPSVNKNRLMLGNGGHRVARAAELGVKKLPVTRKASRSGEDW